MRLIEGGCFVTLHDSMVAMDLAIMEDFARADFQVREGSLQTDMDRLNCCFLKKTAAGLWFAYSLHDEKDTSKSYYLICISSGEFDTNMVSTDYLMELPWSPVTVEDGDGKLASQRVSVYTGTIGLFCVESIRKCVNTFKLNSEPFKEFIYEWIRQISQLTLGNSETHLADIPNGPIGCASFVGDQNIEECICDCVKDPISGEIKAFRVKIS